MGDTLLRGVVVAILGALLVTSVLGESTSSPGFHGMLTVHGMTSTGYVLLTCIVARVLHREPDGLLAGALILSLVAVGVEISQPLWGRSSDFLSYLSNVIGVGLGTVIVQWRRQAANRAVKESEG